MAITTAMCTSFKVELMTGTHNFTASTGNTFKMALIKNGMAGTYGAATTNYSNVTGSSDETSGTGYSAGGVTLTNVTPTSSGTTAYTTFSPNPSWSSASFSCAGCIIYNSSASNKAVSVHDFGGTQTVSAGTFTVVMPTADASNAILRIG